MKKAIIFIFCIINVIWVIPTIIVYSLNKSDNIFFNNSEVYSGITNIFELYKITSEGIVYSISFKDEVVYTQNINIDMKIENYKKDSKYKLKIYINNEFIK